MNPDESVNMACPQCDALHKWTVLGPGETARCHRCHALLLSPRPGAVATTLSLAIAALILMAVAVSFPFLHLDAAGLSSDASVIKAIRAYGTASGTMAPLSLILAALIVFLPVGRLVGLIYALGPSLFNRPPLPQASWVLRAAMRLRPWAMTEIFIVGVAVALVKIAGLASVGFGPAFWAFILLVLLVTAKDALLCERTLWQTLDATRPR